MPRLSKWIASALIAQLLTFGLLELCNAATATSTWTDLNLHGKSAANYVGPDEELDIDYTAGQPVEVWGDGRITTGNTQDWTVYAWDGSKRNGDIVDSEDPRWRVIVQWNFDLAAYGTGQRNSHHFAEAGGYGAVQGDVLGFDGQEYRVDYQLSGESTYNIGNVQPVGGDPNISYTVPGIQKAGGGYQRIASGFAIDIDQWVLQSDVQVNLFQRGWMTLRSNNKTTDVHTDIDHAVFDGSVDAWDYGTVPPTWLGIWSLD